ncbi:hypothetical protein H2248_007843 [Termitomyces sp. 'cryptogamus']|nr:hypothetical protein H2248_007843 [Termitomyces sp. 'cryptogamus']
MDNFPVLKVPVTFNERFTLEGRDVPAWAEYVISTHGAHSRDRTFEIKYQDVVDQQPAINTTLPSRGSSAIGGQTIVPSRGIPVYAEQPSSLSLTDPVPPKTTRWMTKTFRIGEFKYGRAIECIALIKLKSDPNKFRFLIDTGSCIK